MAEITKSQSLTTTGSELTQFSLLGAAAFVASVGFLYIFYDLWGWYYTPAVALSFGLGSTSHYFLSRWLVFHSTARSLEMGLLYFIIINVIDALIIIGGVTILVQLASADVYVARIGMGLVAGVINFFLNARYNFKAL